MTTLLQLKGTHSSHLMNKFSSYKRKVVNGITWYYGKLSNGKSVWIKKSDLQQQLVKLSKNYRTLDDVTKIQQNVYGAPPQVQRNNSGWSNATYSEIKMR